MSADDIAAKIRKLLAIANDASASEAERDTAMATACRLAEKYAIDMASVGADAKGFGTTVVATFRAKWPRMPQPPEWAGYVGSLLELFFFVKVFSSTRLSCCERDVTVDSEVMLFGAECDRKVGKYIWVYLRREFLRLKGIREKSLRRNLMTNEVRSFYHGVAAGIRHNLQQARQHGADAGDAMKDAAAIIAVARDLDHAFESHFPNCKLTKQRFIEPDVYGYAAGRDVQVRNAVASAVDSPRRLGVSP